MELNHSALPIHSLQHKKYMRIAFTCKVSSHLSSINKSISSSNLFCHFLSTFRDLHGPACGVPQPLIRFIVPKYTLTLCRVEQEKESQPHNLTLLHLCESTVRFKELIKRPLARRQWCGSVKHICGGKRRLSIEIYLPGACKVCCGSLISQTLSALAERVWLARLVVQSIPVSKPALIERK